MSPLLYRLDPISCGDSVEGAVARLLKVLLLCKNGVQIVGGQEGHGTDTRLRVIRQLTIG